MRHEVFLRAADKNNGDLVLLTQKCMELYSWTIGHEVVAVHRQRFVGVQLQLRNECDEKTPNLARPSVV